MTFFFSIQSSSAFNLKGKTDTLILVPGVFTGVHDERVTVALGEDLVDGIGDLDGIEALRVALAVGGDPAGADVDVFVVRPPPAVATGSAVHLAAGLRIGAKLLGGLLAVSRADAAGNGAGDVVLAITGEDRGSYSFGSCVSEMFDIVCLLNRNVKQAEQGFLFSYWQR